jgi:DNA (cytosine-5)-methyltransferase 1
MDLGFAGSVVVRKESIIEDMVEGDYNINGFVKLKQLPFEIIFQNDILPIAKSVAEWNNWNCSNYTRTDIRGLLASPDFNLPMVDVVIGGFPCQDFSHSGKRKGLTTDRGTLYHSFIEVIRRCKPLVFVAENVHGLLTMKGVIETITTDFSNCGYKVEYQLVKCEEHGIPQTRWRTIIMGVRSDKQHLLQNNWHLITENKVKCPVGHYLKHLLEPEDTTDPAQQVYSKASKLNKGQGQKEILLTQCAPTIRAEHHGNIEFRRVAHGNNEEGHLQERRLTLREVALIQTFPPDCILTDPNGRKTSTSYKPIGNAVPPLLSYLIARKVNSILQQIQ